jgi:hypothetical protein
MWLIIRANDISVRSRYPASLACLKFNYISWNKLVSAETRFNETLEKLGNWKSTSSLYPFILSEFYNIDLKTGLF